MAHKSNSIIHTLHTHAEKLVGTHKFPVTPAKEAGAVLGSKHGKTAGKKAGKVLGHYSHNPVKKKN